MNEDNDRKKIYLFIAIIIVVFGLAFGLKYYKPSQHADWIGDGYAKNSSGVYYVYAYSVMSADINKNPLSIGRQIDIPDIDTYRLPEADPSTFKLVGDFAVDTKNVYYNGNVLSGIDATSFRINEKDPNFIMDKTAVYHTHRDPMNPPPMSLHNQKNDNVPTEKPSDMEAYIESYTKDLLRVRPSLQIETRQLTEQFSSYIISSPSPYTDNIEIRKIPGLDPETFSIQGEQYPWGSYLGDKEHIYMMMAGQIANDGRWYYDFYLIPGITSTGFEVIGQDRIKDKSITYKVACASSLTDDRLPKPYSEKCFFTDVSPHASTTQSTKKTSLVVSQKTYINQKYGFELMYPSNYTVTRDETTRLKDASTLSLFPHKNDSSLAETEMIGPEIVFTQSDSVTTPIGWIQASGKYYAKGYGDLNSQANEIKQFGGKGKLDILDLGGRKFLRWKEGTFVSFTTIISPNFIMEFITKDTTFGSSEAFANMMRSFKWTRTDVIQ